MFEVKKLGMPHFLSDVGLNVLQINSWIGSFFWIHIKQCKKVYNDNSGNKVSLL